MSVMFFYSQLCNLNVDTGAVVLYVTLITTYAVYFT